MKKTIYILIIFIFFSILILPSTVQMKEIEKISYLFKNSLYVQANQILKDFKFEKLSHSEMKFVTKRLKRIAYMLIKRGEIENASVVFHKIIEIDSSSWEIRNGQELVNRIQGEKFYNPGIAFSQLNEISKDFEAKFILTTSLSTAIFLSAILLFFLTMFYFFVKKFKLAANDMFIDESGGLNWVKLGIASLVLFWPVLVLSGWAVYPFLAAGFIWYYLNKSEKRIIIVQIIIVATCIFSYAFRNYLVSGVNSTDFKIAKNLINDRSYERSEYSGFENSLKVLQAFSFFKKGDNDTALDLLISTGENYRNILKFNLLGNIYFKSDNLENSLKYLKSALEMNEKDKTALNNFAVLLIEMKNAKVYESYSNRYPNLTTLKSSITGLKDPVIEKNYLWKRLLKRSEESVSALTLSGHIIKEFFKLPIFYISIIFILYVFTIKRIYKNAGKSVFCKKCSKIISSSGQDKSNVYCDQCYELFQLKDAVLIEAKIAKEAELKEKKISLRIKYLIISLFFPGFVLLEKKKSILFTVLEFIYLFLLFFSVLSISYFRKFYGLYPIFLNFTMIFAILVYLSVNIYSLKGDENGL